MLHVFKNKSHDIFAGYFKNDINLILKDIGHDVFVFIKTSPDKIKNRPTVKEVRLAIKETLITIKIIPKRVTEGFRIFREDFLNELEKIADQKHKTIFCIKVIGALSTFVLGNLAGLRGQDRRLSPTSLVKFVQTLVVFRLTQILLLRIINEVQSSLKNEDDLKNLNYFRSLLTDSKDLKTPLSHEDEAILIVEKLKKYILTGETASN